jgi:hypothetical protein
LIGKKKRAFVSELAEGRGKRPLSWIVPRLWTWETKQENRNQESKKEESQTRRLPPSRRADR